MKMLLKVVAALALLVVLAVGALLLFFDPNAYKEELVAVARDKGQLALTIDGDIGWSLFPSIALALPRLSVADLDGKPLAAVDGADVSVAVMPLLSGRLEMSGVSVRGLSLDISAPSDEEADATEPAKTAAEDKGGVPELDIGYVELKDANIRYRMPATGQVIEITDLNFYGQPVVSGRPFAADVALKLTILEEGKAPSLTLDVELATQLLLDLAQQRFGAEELALKLTLGGSSFSGQRVPLTLNADLGANLTDDSATLKQLQLAIGGLTMTGELAVAQMSGEPIISGQLNAAPFDLNELLKTLGQAAVVTQDSEALKQLGFNAILSGPANTVALDPFKLQLDDTRFTGRIAMDLATGRQQVKLQGDQLNLDRYLPPAVEESQTTDASPATAGERYPKTPLLPLEVLRGLNFDVQLGLGELIASGLRLSELKLAAKANSGLIEVSQIDGKLYGGGFSNSATLDVRQEPIRSVVQKRVTSIQLGGLLKDLADVDKVAGTFSTEGRYTTHGNSIHAMVNSLTGSGTIRLKNGQLKGVNLVDSLCEGIRQVKGLPESDGTSPDYTEFSNLSATLAITNGVVSNDDLAASMVAMGLTGRGKVNLPASEFDYGLDLTVLQQLQGEKCQIEEKLHNLAFPVRCKGSFDDEPAKLCGPDTKRMKQVVKDLFKRDAGDKVKQTLDEKLKDNDKVKSVLKGLFN